MKKLFYAFIFLMPIISFSQVKLRSEVLKSKKVVPENFQTTDLWLDWEFSYIINFEQNPVGLKRLFEKLESLFKDNDLLLEKPYIDKSLIANYVKSLSDYQTLNISILAGDTEIVKMWQPYDGRNTITLRLDKDKYLISIAK